MAVDVDSGLKATVIDLYRFDPEKATDTLNNIIEKGRPVYVAVYDAESGHQYTILRVVRFEYDKNEDVIYALVKQVYPDDFEYLKAIYRAPENIDSEKGIAKLRLYMDDVIIIE